MCTQLGCIAPAIGSTCSILSPAGRPPDHNCSSALVLCSRPGPLGSGKLSQAVEDSYGEEAFDEGAAQVQRLLSRDRKELTGIEDIGQGFQTEFDDEGSEQKAKQPKANSTKQEHGAKKGSPKPSSFTSGKVPLGCISKEWYKACCTSKPQSFNLKAATPCSTVNNSLSQCCPMILIHKDRRICCRKSSLSFWKGVRKQSFWDAFQGEGQQCSQALQRRRQSESVQGDGQPEPLHAA